MDNINNTQAPEPKENNKLIIIIATAVIAALVALFVILGITFHWFGGGKSAEKATSANQAPTINVVDTKGEEGKTRKMNISVRDVKFGDSIKKVKKFEDKQDDTIANPSEASTKDGYTYLTYLFNPKKANFYGVKPAETQTGALLQYVFKDKKVFDIRIQLGNISKADRAKLKKALVKKYGKPTFSIKYSNKSYRDSWRTSAKKLKKQTMLSLNYSPNSGTIISYESFNR